MRSYTFIEKQGDQIISRSYSSDTDNPSCPAQDQQDTAAVTTDQGQNLNSVSGLNDDQPFKDRPIAVSSLSHMENEIENLSSHSECFLGGALSQDGSELGSSPDKPFLCPGSPFDPSSSDPGDPVHIHVQPSDLPVVSHNNQTYFVPVKDSSPASSLASRHSPIDNKGEHPTTASTQPTGIAGLELPTDSPTKSCKSRDVDSIASFDTDEWADGQLEEELSEPEEREHQEKKKEKEEEETTESRSKWSEGWSKGPEFSEEGLPLITMALISRRSRHRAGKIE